LATSSVSPAPFFSDDGQWVAFSDLGKLRKVSVEGGSAITLCDTPQLRGGTWTPDGTIIASLDGAVLSTVPAAGGAPAPLTQLTGLDAMHRWPHMLPGGRALLFTSRSRAASYDEANIEVLSLRDRHRTIVVRGGTFGRYLPAPGGRGYLVYINRGTLFAVRFDVDELKTVGTPSPVLEDIGYNNVNGAAQFDASRTGTVVYRSGVAGGLISLRWLDAGGRTDPLPVKPGVYNQPRLSPDGKLLALSVSGASGVDIWVYDWQRDAMSRLTSGGASYVFPVWSPDGRYLVFTAGFGGRGIFWTRADGASKPQLLVESTNALFPWSFSPDGTRLAYRNSPDLRWATSGRFPSRTSTAR
jgi:WD40 repeat protein